MQRPSPESYGLVWDDLPILERRERRIASLLHYAGAGIGALCGFVIFGRGRDWGAFVGSAWVGFLIAAIVAKSWADSLARKFDSRFQRSAEFKAALKAFEEWDLRTRSEFWQSLPGRGFEQELAKLIKLQGYDVELTPVSGDHGIDIILRRSGRTTIVQCKQTKQPVGPAVARELYGALMHSKADDGILAVTGGVTSGVHQFFAGKPLRVMDLSEILELHQAERGAGRTVARRATPA